MNINYRRFKSSDSKIVAELIHALYQEDPSDRPMLPEKIESTFTTLTHHPDHGVIIVFELEEEIIGYSILINFWSNERGGNIIHIDELYVKREYRSQGISTNFIRYLAETKFGNSVAIQLEVTQDNIRARQLYEHLGFKLHKNNHLVLS